MSGRRLALNARRKPRPFRDRFATYVASLTAIKLPIRLTSRGLGIYFAAAMGTALLTAAAMLLISVAGGRPRIVVANEQAVSYGLARMFELMRGAMGGQFHVVLSVDELKNGWVFEDFPNFVLAEEATA